MNTEKKMKVVFAPGALDNFEGSQEELDELVAQIHALAESGEIMEIAEPLDEEALEDDPELEELLEEAFKALQENGNRTLH